MPRRESSQPLLGPRSRDDDQLSPTDGYFESRHHPQDLFNEAPVADEESDEISEESPLYTPQSPFSSPSALSGAGWRSNTGAMPAEGDLLLTDDSPPPQYSRVNPMHAIGRTVTGNQSHSGSSRILSVRKVSGAAYHYLPSAIDPIDIEPQEWNQFCNHYFKHGRREERRQKFRRFCRGLCKHVIVGLALFGLAAVTMMWVMGFFSWMPACMIKDFHSRDYQIQNIKYFDFSDSDHQNSGLPKGFSGVMHVLSGPSDQTVDLNVSIRSIASDLHGGNTDANWRPSSLISCAEVALYFRPGLEISNLRIASSNLRLLLSSDLTVTESTTISLRKGNLVSESFDSSRETYIDVRTSTVKGTFGLRDVLSIKTRSGSVSVDINPKTVFNGLPKPAVLEVESRSGSVNIQYPANEIDIPNRDYRSTITSRSGSVKGKILHGEQTTIDIRSGSLDAKILPYGGADHETSSLSTKIESGSSSIELLRPYREHGNPFTRMSSSHSARSGHLRLRYPDEWQGNISGESRSGSISLRGRDVEIIDERSAHGARYVKARKGHGKSTLTFNIRSGSVDATIGE